MNNTLTPAYGRDYKSKAAVEADFRANKDFIVAISGKPINIEQLSKGERVSIRYDRLRKVVILTV